MTPDKNDCYQKENYVDAVPTWVVLQREPFYSPHTPSWKLWIVRLPRLKLEHLALLVMSIEQADERLGDLDEKRAVIDGRHGPRYARVWYLWTGTWIILSAILRKTPGRRLLDLLIARLIARLG